MANQTHSTITDPDLHEPKGYSTASRGRTYMANGSGSGTFGRPLVLISSSSISAAAATDIENLGDYYQLIFVTESSDLGTNAILNLQLYGDTTADWLTAGSDYDHSLIREAGDEDEDTLNAAGLLVGSTYSSNRQYLQAVTRISNFNVAGQRTRSISHSAAGNSYHPTTASVATDEVGNACHSQTAISEAHSRIRIRLVGGGNITAMDYTLWGIR